MASLDSNLTTEDTTGLVRSHAILDTQWFPMVSVGPLAADFATKEDDW